MEPARRASSELPGPPEHGLRVIHQTGQTPLEIRLLLEAHALALSRRVGVLKDGSRTAVTRVGIGGEFCIKEYRKLGLVDHLKDRLRGSRAGKVWRAAQHLLSRGIATPEPVALVALEPRGSFYLVTRFEQGSIPLSRVLREGFASKDPPQRVAARRALARALGRWLRSVHAAGVYHNDCSAKNVLTTESGEGWSFHLVDLEGISLIRRVTYRRRVKNLAQLLSPAECLTRTDGLRLLDAYDDGAHARARRRLRRDVAARVRFRERRRRRRRDASR